MASELLDADAVSAPQQPADRPTVLVVDADADTREALEGFLRRRGFGVTSSEDPLEAVQRFDHERPTAVILALDDALDALPAMKRIDRDVPVIATSRHGRTSTIVRAIKLGAADFISKPFGDEELEAPLQNALRQRRVAREIARLRGELQSDRAFLLGSTPRMADVADTIQRVADTEATILLRGASGTGKELAARAVHQASSRRDRPLVKVNCAALPTDLLESELFGYERGAFAAATLPKPGKFELANHGTLFLDEIGGLSAALQARLVTVLEHGKFRRIGGQQDIATDVRIIAATNRNLDDMVVSGGFRADLFARLSPITIRLPELRERREEIPLLTQYFLKRYSVQYNQSLPTIDDDTLQLMRAYDWPGNVRELENLIKRVVVFGNVSDLRRAVRSPIVLTPTMPPPATATDTSVRPPGVTPLATGVPRELVLAPSVAIGTDPGMAPGADLSTDLGDDGGTTSLKAIARAAARQAERTVIARMLLRTRWNRKEAAESLGISYKALLYKIKENGLDKAV